LIGWWQRLDEEVWLMAVITISRQLGSFGSVIASLVAEDLGFHLLDREIVDLVAVRARVPAAVAEGVDERAFRGASGVFYSLLVGIQNGRLTPESYVYFATQVIREAASEHDLVILGRAGQVALGKSPRAFHVHLVASKEERVARLVEREHVTKLEAHRILDESDECRRAYVWAAGHRNWDDPTLYDLVLNTSRLTPSFAAAMVVESAREAGVIPRPAKQTARLGAAVARA
jgi:Cytidylate kinase-like family